METLLSSQEANGYLESLGLFLTDHQREMWQALPAELAVWNAQINVVSRKDMEHADLARWMEAWRAAKDALADEERAGVHEDAQ